MSHPELSSILTMERGLPRDLLMACLDPQAFSFPLYIVKVSAVFPSPAADYEELI